MITRRTFAVLVALGAHVLGCSAPGRTYVEIPLHGAGATPAPIVRDGWTVTLERADVGFGPVWLCATEVASPEFCDSAVLEMTGAVTIDALSPEPQMLAEMHGITGAARSAMWDHAISWPGTLPRPRAIAGGPEGHSALFEGRAVHEDGRAFGFRAALDLEPIMQGSVLIHGRRIPEHAIADRDDALVVRFDPYAWWRRVDLDRLAATGADPVVLEPGDPDYEALAIAITAGSLPAFEWARP